MVPEELKTPDSSTSGYIDPLAGTRYRTIGMLGRGGMGEVVEAEHIGLGKRVVVKLLRPELAAMPELVTRMQIEARSLAAVVSPHVVQVSDFGQTADGRTYLVMERLYGKTLAAELEARGALPVVEAIGVVLEVLAGLDAAHAIGIVHRDIKPDNVFLCDPSRDTPRTVKILDFGIAKVLHAAVEGRGPVLPHLATENGALVGTPRVVSPEQARGKPVDARTDLYSVGLLLYTIVVGRGPFAELRDAVELLRAHVEQRPTPPSRVTRQTVHPMLDAAILRALEKRPEDRFQSALEFAAELRCTLAAMRLPPALAFAATEPVSTFSTAARPRLENAGSAPRPADQPTLQLRGAVDASAAPAVEPPRKVAVALEAQAAPARAASVRTLAEQPTVRRGTGWGTFVALALLSAMVSAVLLIVLYRVAGP